MKVFRWSKKAELAAITLADGETREHAAIAAGIGEATLYRWLAIPEFAEEVDRLTFLTGIAHKAERLRLAKRVIRSFGEYTEKDLLDWIRYAQSETDGLKLELTALLSAVTENGAEMAGSRLTRISGPELASDE